MGQSASTQRHNDASRNRDSRRFSQLVQTSDSSSTAREQRQRVNDAEDARGDQNTPPRSLRARSTQPFATFRRQVSAQSTTSTGGRLGMEQSSSTHEEVLFEQEERPLMSMDDLRMRDAPITHITASPMPRRPSVLSRIGSRILPRYTTTGSAAAERGENGDRRALRRRLSDSAPPRPNTTPEPSNHHRFSVFGTLSPGSSFSSQSSPRRRAPISRPIPLMADGSVPPSGLPTTPLHSTTPEPPAFSFLRSLAPNSQENSRRSRIRRSISSLENLISNHQGQQAANRQNPTPPRRPLRTVAVDETDYLLPPLSVTDTSLDLDETAAGEYGGLEQRHTATVSPVAELPERSPSWTSRWTDRAPAVRRESRRMPNLLRGRSSRIIRRDDEAPLSRILQLAAAAIAAQLSGAPSGITDLEPMSEDTLDGSLNAFMESLNQPTGTGNSSNDSPQPLTNLPPLNFLRVFRFVNPNGDGGNDVPRLSGQTPARNAQANPTHTGEESTDGRTVTLVVVGVRSVPSSSIAREDADGNLDTILNLPLVPSSPLRNGGGGSLLRHASGRSRLTTRRRASIGGVNPFPANYDSQRHQRTQATSRPVSGDTTPVAATTIPTILSESPPGPHPPPSTPAEPGLSAQPSGTTTPNRRPSSASAAQHAPGAYQDNISERLNETYDIQNLTNDPYHAVRQRRRSDSEFARHRDLGAGAARRNGVVEPDDAIPQARSWLIYVVGTNLSEDHPAFATPSLFTDVSIPSSFHRLKLC